MESVSSFFASGRYDIPMGSERMPFGKWLDEQLQQRGWEAQDLADRIGVGSGTVSRWRTGRRKRVPPEYLERIARAFDIDLDEVLYYAGQISRLPESPSEYERKRLQRELRQVAMRIEEVVQADLGLAVPYYGPVPADAVRWVGAEEEGDTVRVLAEWIGTRSPRDVFVVTASGDCLRERGILSGNYVLMERPRGKQPANGEIVLVRIGDEYALKIWQRNGDWIELHTADGKPVTRLSIFDEFELVGIYVAHWHVRSTP